MNIIIELIILIFLAIYFMIGFSQIFTAFRMKRETNRIHFRRKDLFVSVIIPIKEISRISSQHFESACKQDYPSYEVLFVAESVEDPAYKIAAMFAKRYDNTKVLISGQHDSSRTIGKCHNLAYAVKHANGDVFLFGDSDVTYPQDWITKMTSPLQERADGRQIDVVTSPFFIEPEGFLGKFIALSVSLVTFTASFTNENHRFPSYASGASIAVTKRLFENLGIAQIWENTFNDDLVLADEVIDRGHHIYNQLDNLNHPNEAFLNLRQTKEKLIRWVVTISSFGHKNLRAEVPYMVARNLQFQVALILGFFLYLLGSPGLLILGIVIAGYFYSVFYRWLIGQIIEERNLSLYYLLAPISVTAMILFFLLVRVFYRSFSWEGKTYAVKGRYSM
jgi:glycosyltransferase involved in cell wall biosynthesis